MNEPFSVEWLTSTASAFDVDLAGVERPVTIGLTVLNGPDGDIPTVWTLTDQQLQARIDPSADTDLVMTIPWADAHSLLDGSLPPSVAYMRGKLKAAGDMTLLLTLLRESESAAFTTWRIQAAA